METIQERAKEIVKDKLEIVEDGQITPEASFSNDLGADSLDTAELVIEFEKKFDIKIADDEWEKVDTFSDAVALIERKLEKSWKQMKIWARCMHLRFFLFAKHIFLSFFYKLM